MLYNSLGSIATRNHMHNVVATAVRSVNMGT